MGFGTEAAGKRAKQEEGQTCLPVTIRAIEAAVANREDTGGELRFFGAEHGMLILMGAVETVVKQSASFEFSLNDATGRIKARYFVTDVQPKELDEIVPGRYVCMYGNVRTAPVVHFAAVGVRLVRSADEVSYHMIESAHAALKLQKGQREPATPSPKKPAAAMATETVIEGFGDIKMETPPKETTSQAATVAAAAPQKPVRLEGDALNKALVGFIQGLDREEGVPLAELYSHFSAEAAEEVKGACDKLVNMGELYTTLDDETFAAV